MFKTYYNLAKPGIIYGNAVTAAAGFFLASKGYINWRLFLAMLLGISFVMASACVFNNLADRDIDEKMARTKNRAMVTGSISKRNAIIYATILGILGFLVLWLYTNPITTLIAFIGFFVYTLIYTPLKKRTVHATLIGAIAGAVPPVVGYCAVSNQFDLGAVLLFFILVLWQLPHFYAIGIFRHDDYAAANIPILPVKKGIAAAKINMLLYIVAFIFATTLLTLFHYTGYVYLVIVGLLSIYWAWYCIQGFSPHNNDAIWARKMFRLSLIVLSVFSFMISITALFPPRT